MNKEVFNNLEVKDQIDFINKELENKSLTKISEEIKVSRKTLRYRFEKIGYVYDKQSNKYIEKSINKDLNEINNTINTNNTDSKELQEINISIKNLQKFTI